MPEWGQAPEGPDDPGGRLEHELADLGPLMVRQERAADSPPDEEFSVALRARLLGQAQGAPPASRRRSTVLGLAPWAGIAAVLAAAVLIVVLHLRSNAGLTRPVAGLFYPPTPGTGDLTKSYPLLGGLGGGGAVNPFESRIETIHGQAYPGHLILSAGSLPSSPAQLPAYRLRPTAHPLGRAVRDVARRLAMNGSVLNGTGYIDFRGKPRMVTYLAVVQGGGSLGSPLRSIAISAFDGRLIFHDTTYDRGVRPGTSPARNLSVSVARRWLSSLGWPGATMPVQAANALPFSPGGLRQITFGWPGISRADTSAATLQIDGAGHVTEALVLPPLAGSVTLPAVSVARVWASVRGGRVPLGVRIIPRDPTLPGSGRLQVVTVEQVLTITNSGVQYLVPAYRFDGVVRIEHTPGNYVWLALAPAVGAR